MSSGAQPEDPMPQPPMAHPPPVNPYVPLKVDGIFGAGTIKALQFDLSVAQDGDFGPGTKKALQSYLGVAHDGVIGPATVRALQRRVGDPVVNGDWDARTTRYLQEALNAGTF